MCKSPFGSYAEECVNPLLVFSALVTVVFKLGPENGPLVSSWLSFSWNQIWCRWIHLLRHDRNHSNEKGRLWSQTVWVQVSAVLLISRMTLNKFFETSEPQFYHLWNEANNSNLPVAWFWEINEVMCVRSSAWGQAHGRCSVNVRHFWWWCCCWNNLAGTLWRTGYIHGLGDQLSWFVQGGGISQDMGPTALEEGVYWVNQDGLLTLMSIQSSVQSELVASAGQIPTSCIYNSHLCSKEGGLIFDLHFIDVGVGRNRIVFASFWNCHH